VAKWIEESNEEDMTWVRQIADDAAKTLREAGLIAIGEVREGEPKRVLVDEAEEWHADAIFVGSTGSGGRIKRFMLGSVSAAVVARAGCSVEVVRARRVD
jgi:nucleotide-binding universal stress UspA family protein